jgi:hypothetical protein
MAVSFLSALRPINRAPLHIGPTKITQAALYAELKDSERAYAGSSKQSPVFIYASELAINMADFGGGTLTNELIDFYDSKAHDVVLNKRTMSGGTIKLFNPSLTLLGCTTDSFLQEAAANKLITSGLASRIVFCVEPNRVPKQRQQIELDDVAHTAILAGFEQVFDMRGEFVLDPEANELQIAIAEASDEACYTADNELHQNYFGRKPDHTIKLGMAIAASHGRKRIKARDLQLGLSWLEELEPDMIKAFGVRDITKDDNFSGQIERSIPWEPNWISVRDMLAKLHKRGKYVTAGTDLSDTLHTLSMTGAIKRQVIGNQELVTRIKEPHGKLENKNPQNAAPPEPHTVDGQPS